MSKNKGHKIQFSSRTHPVGGVVSVVCGALSIFLLLVLTLMSWSDGGESGIWIGFMGVVTFVLSVIGFVLAIRCYRKEDIYMVTPTTGSIMNGIILVLMMLLYVVGAVN